MRNIITIARRELGNYFINPVGYVFAGLLLVVTSWLFLQDLFLVGQADLTPMFNSMTFLFSIFIPAISMGLIADEKKNGTWEILLATPTSENEWVWGKFLGSGLYLIGVMAMSLPLALTVFWLGNPDVGKILTGFLGIFLLGLAYLSVGVFCSSLSYQSMVGFLVSSVVLITNNLLGQEMLLIRIPAGWREAVSYLSLDWHARQFSQGIISVKDSVFFVSWIVIFLVATGLVLKARGK